MAALALIGWLAWLAFGGYVAFAGFGFAYLSGGFTGRVSAVAVIAGLVGVALVVAALWCAPFTLSWRH